MGFGTSPVEARVLWRSLLGTGGKALPGGDPGNGSAVRILEGFTGYARERKAPMQQTFAPVVAVQTEQGPVYYLTNGSCESTDYWTPQTFDYLGLPYQGETEWGPYPLSREEERYIAEDGVNTRAGGSLSLGYSIFWQGKKWLAPTIEYPYSRLGRPSKRLKERVLAEERRIKRALDALGVQVIEDFDCCDDRLCLIVALPFEEVMKAFGGLDSWKAFLQRTLGEREEAE